MFARELIRGARTGLPACKWWRIGLLLLAAPLLIVACTTLGKESSDTTLNCRKCTTLSIDTIFNGDTFDSGMIRVRLSGVNAPQSGQRCYDAATNALRELAGTTVRVERGPTQEDASGRSLFYVFTESGRSIDELLVRGGFAEARSNDGQYYDTLVRLEVDARKNKQGCLWAG